MVKMGRVKMLEEALNVVVQELGVPCVLSY